MLTSCPLLSKLIGFLLNNKKKKSVFKSSVSPARSLSLSSGTVFSGTFICTWYSDICLSFATCLIKLAYVPLHQKKWIPSHELSKMSINIFFVVQLEPWTLNVAELQVFPYEEHVPSKQKNPGQSFYRLHRESLQCLRCGKSQYQLFFMSPSRVTTGVLWGAVNILRKPAESI